MEKQKSNWIMYLDSLIFLSYHDDFCHLLKKVSAKFNHQTIISNLQSSFFFLSFSINRQIKREGSSIWNEIVMLQEQFQVLCFIGRKVLCQKEKFEKFKLSKNIQCP